jgi:hypothetical protein
MVELGCQGFKDCKYIMGKVDGKDIQDCEIYKSTINSFCKA